MTSSRLTPDIVPLDTGAEQVAIRKRAECLAHACTIAHHIAQTAEWYGERCSWRVFTVKGRGASSVVEESCGPSLYSGSAGIALFLIELIGATPPDSNTDVAIRTARGGLQHAITASELTRPAGSRDFGFFIGSIGLAYALWRFHTVVGENVAGLELERLLDRLSGRETVDGDLDVIGGAAGAIPALLAIATSARYGRAAEIAERLGDHLLAVADEEAYGWSWSLNALWATRNLTGLAHGASGMARAFFELYGSTGQQRYLTAAREAIAYEQRQFSAEYQDWPDFRDAVGTILREGTKDEIAAITDQGIAPYRFREMHAWCHGAPGIALTRSRAYEITGELSYKEQLIKAYDHVRNELSQPGGDYSLCHGNFGIGEIATLCGATAGDQDALATARDLALVAARCFHSIDGGREWPGGIVRGRSDATLMTGVAGIGYHLLRLARPDVPSILLLPINCSRHLHSRISPTYCHAMTPEGLLSRYPLTVRGLRVLARVNAAAEFTKHSGLSALRRLIECCAPPTKALLFDLWQLEHQRFDFMTEEQCHLEQIVALLSRRPRLLDEQQRAVLRRSRRVRVCWTKWDWRPWIEQDATSQPREKGRGYLLLKTRNTVRIQATSQLAAAVLDTLAEPSTVDTLMHALVARAEGRPASLEQQAQLRVAIMRQLQSAYDANLIESNDQIVERRLQSHCSPAQPLVLNTEH